MGRRAAFSPDSKSHDLEDHPVTNDHQNKDQETSKPSESSFALARAIAKWILISFVAMMAVGYLIETLDSKARSSLERPPGRH